jgi:chloramphenicol-sensitive protein RarD
MNFTMPLYQTAAGFAGRSGPNAQKREASRGTDAFVNASLGAEAWLMLAGLITAIPLLLFAPGARRIPPSMFGLIQYVAPTLQFLIGVVIHREPGAQVQLIGFGAIWIALAVYAFERLWRAKVRRA